MHLTIFHPGLFSPQIKVHLSIVESSSLATFQSLLELFLLEGLLNIASQDREIFSHICISRASRVKLKKYFILPNFLQVPKGPEGDYYTVVALGTDCIMASL